MSVRKSMVATMRMTTTQLGATQQQFIRPIYFMMIHPLTDKIVVDHGICLSGDKKPVGFYVIHKIYDTHHSISKQPAMVWQTEEDIIRDIMRRPINL